MKKTLLIIVAIAVIIIAWFWLSYNKLVTANEQVDNSWAQVEVQYQRRFDLIPNLVSSVQGAMTQEKEVFGDLAAARAGYSGAVTVSEKAAAATQVEGAFGRLLAIMEAYPTLKSIETVQSLMTELAGTENRISVERKRFNDQVTVFNLMVKRVPMNIMAGIFNYPAKTYFNVPTEAATAPKVDLQGTK